MDTIGAIVGPLTALWLLQATHHNYRAVFLWTLLPGMIAVASFWLLVRERPIETRKQRSFLASLRAYREIFAASSSVWASSARAISPTRC